jgi:NTP pyrophosphatase (non-canonical NTP hydrolase)
MPVEMFDKVWEANPTRTMEIMSRRMIKLGEEYGEACQAYLSVSSENNGKEKTWADVREELTDVLIVTLDLLCHQMPDEELASQDHKRHQVHQELDRKLKKWHKKIKKRQDTSE